MNRTPRLLPLLFLVVVLSGPGQSRADSVAQIQTAKRISRSTAILLDPQGRPGTVPGGSDTTVRVGDILTFVIQFTPVPNGATRGLGGYITDYIPRNTEVVGARMIDRDGNTVFPHRGGLGPDGVGDRGPNTYTGTVTLNQGSLSQLYADTGIFFSTSPLTARVPSASTAADRFTTLFNGLPMNPSPTGAGQLQPILGAQDPVNAHNAWDLAQAFAFGINSGAISDRGRGPTPDFYGSPVAGPDTWYPFEATYVGPLGGVPTVATVVAIDRVGPWERIRTPGSEIGTRGAVPDGMGNMPDPGGATRTGIPALDPSGNPTGWDLSPTNPLPSYDPMAPNQPYTTAVRYAVGELVVGEEYFAEISLRVKDTPLDPDTGMDANCAEVFGGDASAREAGGGSGGKDNAWRYFVPAPSCVVLNNFFELSVDKLAALPTQPLTYTIEGKNLSTNPQTNVVVRQCFPANLISFVGATGGGTLLTAGTGCPDPAVEDAIEWTVGMLAPGADFLFTTDFTVTGGDDTAMSRAIFTSDALPVPGFQVVAMTNIVPITVVAISASAVPSLVPTVPSQVHYQVNLDNDGTGPADVGGCNGGCRLHVTLPAGFAYVPGSAQINAGAVADPAVNGDVLTFSSGLVAIAPAATMTLDFDSTVGAGVMPGAYALSVESWLEGAFGRDINDARAGLAEVLVGIVRSDPPFVSSPLLANSTTVTGTTSEAAGTVIRVFVNGNQAGQTTSNMSGTWSAAVPPLFGAQHVTATAEATGELESQQSRPPVIVQEINVLPECSDGMDNDGDGLTDFPADPGCANANDVDETDQPECSDGLDNDMDGFVDYPDDLSCASFSDNSETGSPECSDGMDNDNNGLTDFPNDPGCADANDQREGTLPQCANGVDDDGDMLVDYPIDPGCFSALDNDEVDGTLPTGDAGVDAGQQDAGGTVDAQMGADAGPDGGGTGADSGTTGALDARTDPGGLPATAGGAPVDEGSCGCMAVSRARTEPPSGAFFWLALGLMVVSRTRRKKKDR